jgi:hypothetical protein
VTLTQAQINALPTDIAGKVAKAGDTMTAQLIIGATPTTLTWSAMQLLVQTLASAGVDLAGMAMHCPDLGQAKIVAFGIGSDGIPRVGFFNESGASLASWNLTDSQFEAARFLASTAGDGFRLPGGSGFYEAGGVGVINTGPALLGLAVYFNGTGPTVTFGNGTTAFNGDLSAGRFLGPAGSRTNTRYYNNTGSVDIGKAPGIARGQAVTDGAGNFTVPIGFTLAAPRVFLQAVNNVATVGVLATVTTSDFSGTFWLWNGATFIGAGGIGFYWTAIDESIAPN